MKKILTVVGARPQFIKSAIVSKSLVKDFQEILVHTGQHYDKNMSDVFFEEMEIKTPDYNLGVGSGSHAVQTASMMVKIEEVLMKEKPDGVLLYGDTNSTLAAAITAAKLNIPIFHVEAGVRTNVFDMPEEQNRVVTDHLSSLLFAATKLSIDNLEKENLGAKAVFSGDVMYDALLYYTNKSMLKDKTYYVDNLHPIFDKYEGNLDEYYLATCHRPENTDSVEKFVEILEALNDVGTPVIFSAHPRIRNLISKFHEKYSNIYFVEPLSYFETLFFTKHAKWVVTDSGGLHKEAYLQGVPCVTILRNGWEETLQGNWNEFVKADRNAIIASIKNRNIAKDLMRDAFGDGNSSQIIVNEIKNFFENK